MKSSLLTVIIPFLNEEDNLKKYPNRIDTITEQFKKFRNLSLQFIFVDDGSTDDSLSTIMKFGKSNVYYISFSKNYGSHYAILSVLDLVESDFYTFMSSDMQEPIDLFIKMYEKILVTPDTIIFGQRKSQTLSGLNNFFSKLYNYLVRKLAFSDFPKNGTDVFMISKKIRDTIKHIEERNTSLYGLLFSIGFKKLYEPYHQLERFSGKSKWNLSKKIKLFSDTFVSFSIVPLRLITIFGLITSFLGFSYGLAIFILHLNNKLVTPGFPTIAALLTFGFGLVFLMIGILSEYIWRIFDQVRPRPRYVIRKCLLPQNKDQ